jgi:hypothetical protein
MILTFMLERGLTVGGLRIAMVLGRVEAIPPATGHGQKLLGERCLKIDIVLVLLIADGDQAGSKARRFERLGDHDGNGLSGEQDLGVMERLERLAGDREFIFPAMIEPGLFRPVEVADDIDHARDRARRILIDRSDPALGDPR